MEFVTKITQDNPGRLNVSDNHTAELIRNLIKYRTALLRHILLSNSDFILKNYDDKRRETLLKVAIKYVPEYVVG